MSINEKFHLTLSQEDGLQIREQADDRGVPAVQVIREIVTAYLQQGQPQVVSSSPEPVDFSPVMAQLQQLAQQMKEIEQAVKQLHDRPSSPSATDPQTRTMFQPIQNRLQQLETQMGVIGNLLQQHQQQTLQRIYKDQRRSELWLEAIYVMVQPMLLDNCSEELELIRRECIVEIRERLEKLLAENE